MGAFGIWQWVVILVIVLVLFGGRGKISALMGDFGKGLKSFKKGMKDEDVVENKDESEDKPSIAKSEDAKSDDKA